jgi:hypothetical protein
VVLKLRPFVEQIVLGSRSPAVQVKGVIEGGAFVVSIDEQRVALQTQAALRDGAGEYALVAAEQLIQVGAHCLQVSAQPRGELGLGATLSWQPTGHSLSLSVPGFTVFFDERGSVDGHGVVRAVSEPPTLN